MIPVFFGKIRSAPFWLTLQAVALAWNGVAQHGDWSAHALVALAEVLVVRALIAPQLLRRAIRGRAEPNLDLMPSNLFTWAIAIALIVLAFEFGAPAMGDRQALTLGAVGGHGRRGAAAAVDQRLAAGAAGGACSSWRTRSPCSSRCCPSRGRCRCTRALGAIYLLTVGVGALADRRGPSAAVRQSATPRRGTA